MDGFVAQQMIDALREARELWLRIVGEAVGEQQAVEAGHERHEDARVAGKIR